MTTEPFGDKEFDYGVGYPTPYSIPDDTSCFNVPVPNDLAWQAVFTGLLASLTEPEAWIQFEGALSQEDAAERWSEMLADFLFKSLLGCGAITPPGIRYNPDDDDVEIQEPDGDWVANPDADPRHGKSNLLPPNETEDPKCNSAANMVAWIKAFIDTLVTVKDETGIITALFLDVLELLWGAGILLALVTVIVETLIFLGLDTIIDAFTDEVYDKLLCSFYENIASDGSVSPDQLVAINDDIDLRIGGTPATVLHLMLGLTGEVGLSNMGSQGTITDADCSDCEPAITCHEWDDPTVVNSIVGDCTYAVFQSSLSPHPTFVKTTIGWELRPNLGATGNSQVQVTFGLTTVIDETVTDLTGEITWEGSVSDANSLNFTIASCYPVGGSNYPLIHLIKIEYLQNDDISWVGGESCDPY